MDEWMDNGMVEEEEEEDQAVSSLEFLASILHIKNYFRQNMRSGIILKSFS
jgi:hypothetical protein